MFSFANEFVVSTYGENSFVAHQHLDEFVLLSHRTIRGHKRSSEIQTQPHETLITWVLIRSLFDMELSIVVYEIDPDRQHMHPVRNIV